MQIVFETDYKKIKMRECWQQEAMLVNGFHFILHTVLHSFSQLKLEWAIYH